MPRLRLDAAPSNMMLENRNMMKTTKSTVGVVAQKVQGPSLRPRAVLGDLTKATAVSTNQVKNEQAEEKMKKPAMGIASRKPLQSTNVKKIVPTAAPKAVLCTKKVEPEAYSTKQLPIEDIDLERDNPQLVSYYAKDIYSYLRQLEKSYLIGAQYMDSDGYMIRPTMRTILVDWLVDVHGRFKMLQETLYLSISVMDSFLQVDSTINRRELQLVGLTAMLIAAKFEETWAPEINDFVYMSDKAYTAKDVLAMECRMLQKLDFRMGRPLPLHFLRRNTQAASQILDQVDVLHHTLSKYLMELTLPEYSFCHYLPSQLAAAALCLSLRILDENDTESTELWNHSMVYYSGYTYESLEPLMEKLCGLIAAADVSKFQHNSLGIKAIRPGSKITSPHPTTTTTTTTTTIIMSSLKMFVLLAVVVSMAAAYPQTYETPYKAASAPAYSPPAYSAPSYKGAGTANGRAKIQVYRGPTKEGGKGYDGFAPWGFYANQPEDNKAQEDIAGKKPIRIEDQEVRDENGRRRFHGAFTGGFSAGYYNTADTKEGWRPAEFKSSRTDRQKKEQKQEDFMDQEDLGAFGIAPQVLRAKDDYGEGHVSRKRLRPVFAATGAIPGLPALHNLLHPVKETIGIKLLRSMGWKPNQGVGERLTKKAKRERRKKYEETKKYGCDLPSGLQQREIRQQTSDGEETGDESDDQLYAPDDVPAFVVKPKTNLFGLGYTGLMPHHITSSSAPKSGFVLFEPTLKLTDRKKKLQIAGQAFGVGAFENEDEDIYSKDDMSQYDFELGGAKSKKKGSNMLALPCSDVLDGFVRAKQNEPIFKRYPPPVIPKDFVPIHRSQHSRFDVKPMTQAELSGLGRHDLNANQRAAILNEVLSMPPETPQAPGPLETVSTPLTPAEVVAQALIQIKKNIAAQQEKSGQTVQDKEQKIKLEKPIAVDPDREAKVAKLKAFVESSRTISSFQPFARDLDKQYRFEAFCILSKNNRLAEFHLLQPENMTAWEREREEVEFDRSLTLYRPLTATMQNRFTSGGHVEENIQGGLVAQIESFLPQETPQPKKIPVVKDPAKQAALRKLFGQLTRKQSQWKPDRLLCIRFNVPNPFPSAGDAQDSAKFVAKGTSGSKFSIFDVLNVVPQAGPSFMSSGYENVPSGPVQGPENKVQELEWDKAERGELQEKAEPDLVPEVGPPEEIKEEVAEEVPYERPPMDVFKAIFADTDSEEEEEEENKEEEDKKVKEVKATREQAKPPIIEEMDDDAYGPRLPASGSIGNKVAVVNLAALQEASSQVEWVERDKAKKKKEHKKDKKKKDKKKKDKKNKKKKRRHSDVGSSASDENVDDMEILKKIKRKKVEMNPPPCTLNRCSDSTPTYEAVLKTEVIKPGGNHNDYHRDDAESGVNDLKFYVCGCDHVTSLISPQISAVNLHRSDVNKLQTSVSLMLSMLSATSAPIFLASLIARSVALVTSDNQPLFFRPSKPLFLIASMHSAFKLSIFDWHPPLIDAIVVRQRSISTLTLLRVELKDSDVCFSVLSRSSMACWTDSANCT
ncbi:LOW QUALITY PROTEIN: G patch domain-containing protein 1-like [Daphnia carinata]|uniref:LOW QUALITY PROTEIN: G patch domain-containing protein 1-like n=1 Tax=Daphnia carinata TaxID=120202 RepID=UPI002868A23F|nr:LOW QUALITY PROTEIN: G patch domain-containing protein 1-like [Daphnia carinata]